MRFLTVLFCTLSVLLMTSCMTPEERAIHNLTHLYEKIEANGETLSEDDWREITEEYEQIHSDLSECDFTTSQLGEVAKLEGKISLAIAAQGGRSLIEQGRDFFKGLLNGDSN